VALVADQRACPSDRGQIICGFEYDRGPFNRPRSIQEVHAIGGRGAQGMNGCNIFDGFDHVPYSFGKGSADGQEIFLQDFRAGNVESTPDGSECSRPLRPISIKGLLDWHSHLSTGGVGCYSLVLRTTTAKLRVRALARYDGVDILGADLSEVFSSPFHVLPFACAGDAV
jgi:hypothetical protein